MLNFKNIIVPTIIGIFGGFLGPILVEKWKGNEANFKKQIIMSAEVHKTQENLNTFMATMESRMSSMENQIKIIELNLSHNAGVLKGLYPNAPLKTPIPEIKEEILR